MRSKLCSAQPRGRPCFASSWPKRKSYPLPVLPNIAIAGKSHHEWVDVLPIQDGDFPLLCLFTTPLVGGWTTPFEKYARQNGNLPQIGVKMKNVSFLLFLECKYLIFRATVVLALVPHCEIHQPAASTSCSVMTASTFIWCLLLRYLVIISIQNANHTQISNEDPNQKSNPFSFFPLNLSSSCHRCLTF